MTHRIEIWKIVRCLRDEYYSSITNLYVVTHWEQLPDGSFKDLDTFDLSYPHWNSYMITIRPMKDTEIVEFLLKI